MQWQNRFPFDMCNLSHYKTRANKSTNCCRSHTYLFVIFLVHTLSWFLRNVNYQHPKGIFLDNSFSFYTLLKREPFFNYKIHCFAKCPIREVNANPYWVRPYSLKAILQSTALMTWQSCYNEVKYNNLPFLKEIKSPKQGFNLHHQIFQTHPYSVTSLQ